MSYFRNRVLLSLLTIVAMAFGPYTALAQNWQPPTGAPPGNNTPAPINISNASQTKSGGLTIGGVLTGSSSIISDISSTLKGQSIFTNTATGTGNNFLVSFIKNYFYSDTQFGQPTPIGYPDPVNPTPVNVGVFGQLKYQTADDNGNPIPVQAGSVLTTDASGNASWADINTLVDGGGAGLPGATITGQTLYWDQTTHTWKIASDVLIHPATGTLFKVDGSLSDVSIDSAGTTSIDTLRVNKGLKVDLTNSPSPTVGQVLTLADNSGNVAWQTAPGTGSVSIDPGTSDGQTLRWNPGQTKWEPTNGVQIHSSAISVGDIVNTNFLQLQTKNNPGNYITLNAPQVHIPLGGSAAANRVLVSTDSQGNLAWANPASIGIGGGGGGNLPPGEAGDTLWFDGTSWLNTNKLQYNGTGNSLRFNGASLSILGDGSEITPGAGRFLYSSNDQGKVQWNPTLTYEDIPANGLTLNTIHIIDPDSDNTTFPAFVNEGFTVLNGATLATSKVSIDADLQIMNQGDIYLDHLDNPTAQELNGVLPICYNNSTHKITKCTAIGEIAGGHISDGNGPTTSLTFYPADNGHDYTFDFTGSIGVKWCGGGGGGGGGGIGGYGPNGFVSGGGGGGGQQGFCQSLGTVHVNQGDVMTWDIGSGGNGGDYAAYYDWDGVPTATSPHAAYPGLQGENTSVYLNGTQLGSTQVGGYGGRAGQSLPVAGNATCAAGNGDVYPCGGDNGNSTLANGTPAEQTFYNGGDGHFNSSYGGSGGSGENPQGMNLPAGAPGHGGGGGTASTTSTVHGHSGRAGADASGGGGGGGSAGPHELFVHCDGGFIFFGGCDFHYEHMLNGGNGGRGGDGYVTISGIPAAPQQSPTEIVFDTPGTYTFVPGTLPGNAQVLNVEVWGAGGGGGSVSSLAGENCSGGGGSGSYGRLENFPRPTGSITVVVGAGGASGGISNNPVSGGNGGLSRFGTLITAFGGSGSSGDGNSNGCSAGGSAGQTATGATQTISGTNGQPGTAGGPAAAGGVGPQGYGSGGNGGLGGGFNTPATNGSAGRVRITWD